MRQPGDLCIGTGKGQTTYTTIVLVRFVASRCSSIPVLLQPESNSDGAATDSSRPADGRRARIAPPVLENQTNSVSIYLQKKKSYQQIQYRCFGLYFTRHAHARCLIALSNLLSCSSSLLSTMWWNIRCLVDIPKYLVVFHKFHVQCCIYHMPYRSSRVITSIMCTYIVLKHKE
jgi:hypothetical protein